MKPKPVPDVASHKLALVVLLLAFPSLIASAHIVHHDYDNSSGSPAFPAETRIDVERDSETGVAVTVTLVFPHNGFEVTDWGEVVHHGPHFFVSIEAVHGDGMLPVVTKFSNTYRLGRLPPGDYSFEVFSHDRPLAGKKFSVSEDEAPPFPARAKVNIHQGDDGVTIEAVIRFMEKGWVVRDWGFPMRRGHFWSIHVEAARIRELDEDRVDSDSHHVLEARHRYPLGEVNEPGIHYVQFFVNGHELARGKFIIREDGELAVELRVEPLLDEAVAHPLFLIIRPFDGPVIHDADEPRSVGHGIDTDSLGRNLRIVGPDGYDRLARLVGWEEHSNALVVEYEALPPPPHRVWSERNNGQYRVGLLPHSIRRTDGSYLPGQRLGHFDVKIHRDPHRPPMPGLQSFHVWRPEVSIPEISMIGTLVVQVVASNIVITDWGELAREGRHLSVDIKADYAADGGAAVITYHEHDYALGELKPGDYRFILYSRGHYRGSTHFTVEGDAESPPRARVVSEPLTEPSRHPYLFAVHYRSPAGMDLDSIRETILRVSGPNHFGAEAELRALGSFSTLQHEGEIVRAVYAVAPPHGGWTADANGRYGIHVPHESIGDQAGNYLPGGRIGGFYVAIRHHQPELDEPVVTVTVRRDDDGVCFANVTFDPSGTGWKIVRWSDLYLKTHTFGARVEIDEDAGNAHVQENSYRLGRLPDGRYGFVLRGSNGFVSHHTFFIGDEDSVSPYERWLAAREELFGDAPEDGFREYAFALDPREPDLNPIRILHEKGQDGKPRISISYPEVPSATDVVYRVEGTRNLREWEDITSILFTRETALGPDGSLRRKADLPDRDDYRFLRVRASPRN